MAVKPLKPCRHAGCPALTRDGWCDAHRPKHQRRDSAEYHDMYNTKMWKRLRSEQLIKEPFCRECARSGVRTQAEVVDHIRPWRGDMHLFLDKSNYQSLCKYHHDKKTAIEQRNES